jgi:nucleoid-associated protein YgaU
VTRSRKLCVAALLLAGGYGLASILGGLTELVLPNADSTTASGRAAGLLSTLRGFVPHRGSATTTGELVPEAEDAPQLPQGSSTATRQVAEQPTWLTSTSQPNIPPTFASQPAFATAPALGERGPIANTIGSTDTEPARTVPKARITNVLAASAESTLRPVSPWDRWPRWDARDRAAGDGPVAATFQYSSAARSKAVQATFSRSDVVRKNSPDQDPGAAAESGGRTHLVVDGDSLAKLAERYLDDAGLDDEIYRLNRDVLASPELLPIGVELRIPDSRLADSAAALPATHSLAAAKPSVPSGMVPVEWSPKASDGVPRAELLRPIPAGRAD